MKSKQRSYAVSYLNRSRLALAVLAFYVLPMLTFTLPSVVEASSSATFLDVKVDHVVDIRESGLLVINNTITFSGLAEGVELPKNYVLGFPFAYKSTLAYAFAYETSNPASRLKLDLNAGMGKIGFYGVDVSLPAAVESFTVVFVFSNSISVSILPLETQTAFYNATFPAYPSLPQLASEVNLKIITPTSLNFTRSSYEQEGVSFIRTTEGSRHVFTYVKTNLTEFSDQPAWFYASKTSGTTQLLDVEEVTRKIEIFGNEQIGVSDSYKIVNKVGELEEIHLRLQAESYAVSAFDEFGSIPETNVKTEQASTYTNITVTFSLPRAESNEFYLLVQYNVPWKRHITVGSLGEFNVSLSLFENTDWVVRKLTVSIFLSEGASLRSPVDRESLTNVQNTAFLSSLVFVYQNATPFHDFSFDFTYQRQIFWDSFRPTIWMGAFALVVGAMIGAWRVYQPPPAPALPTAVISVRADDLKNFVTYYDEKRRLLKEAESLETAARKGRMPRRQYKVRKMTIDSRLNSLSRDLAALRDKLRGAGPRYAELMRQLEVAETELQGVEANISRTEIRYRRGEISAAAYHKVLEDSFRRRDRAQTTIDGVLLRLREEST